jgi:hypothetical protein
VKEESLNLMSMGLNPHGYLNSGLTQTMMPQVFYRPMTNLQALNWWMRHEAGFSMDQLHQAEEELSTPSHGSSKVCENLKEGSLVKKVIDVWMHNRWNMGRPWSGPLPPPRQSPLRTLGDALANSKSEW